MFRHKQRMVGQPKTLYDIRKLEGSISLTCASCGKVKVYDLEELIRERSFHRQSMDWQVYLHEAFCWHCSPERTTVKGGIIPFGGNDRELRARRADTLIINLALTVLKDAASRASAEDVNTPRFDSLFACSALSCPIVGYWCASGMKRLPQRERR